MRMGKENDVVVLLHEEGSSSALSLLRGRGPGGENARIPVPLFLLQRSSRP